MAADGVQEQVLKLQSRLSATQEPKKLLKTLKRLNELPVTVDILADTGIGKTVNGFRKHDVIGESAKNLVSKWKKLVPQEVERSTNTLEEREFACNKGVSKKRHKELSPEGYRQTFQTPRGESYESNYEHVHAKGRRSLESEKSCTYSSHDYQSSKSHSKEHVERWTKSPPVEDYDDKIDSSDEDVEQTLQPPKSFHKTHQDYLGSRAEVGMGHDKEHKSSHKEKQHSVLKGEEKYKLSSLQVQDKMNKSCSKEQYNHRDQGDCISVSSSHKKPRLQTEENLDDRKDKHRGSDKRKSDHDEQRSTLDKPKEKPTSNKQKDEVESKKSKSAEKFQSVSFQKDSTNAAVIDEFEEPTMSFESYLIYDQPQKRKKKISKPVTGKVKETRPLKSRGSDKPTSKSGSKVSNSSHGEQNTEKKKAKRRAEDVPNVKSKKMMIDVVPVLPDIPLPLIQPNYRPLPSMDFTPLSPPKRKAVSILSEEDLGFTGRRLNSKMQVYSGSKTVYLPKMMSLFEQCIRVLQNNVDSIHEVGGVPFEILEPVLERCTPDQLYRIENCNPIFVEETNHLWLRHCKRDFKNQDRQEFESWREMYLRLHDEREQKLRAITQSISSAHASKPKGRQAKLAFLNTEVKPPRDVRRRQEKHGTGISVPAPPRIKMHSQTGNSSSGGTNQSFDSPGPSTSHGFTSSSLTTSNSGGGIYESKKPQVKKIAPMMAKTIKIFKNRFSRR